MEGLRKFAEELTNAEKQNIEKMENGIISEDMKKEMKAYREFINEIFSEVIKLEINEGKIEIDVVKNDNNYKMEISGMDGDFNEKKGVHIIKRYASLRIFKEKYEIFQIFGNRRMNGYINEISEGMKFIDKDNGYFQNEEQFDYYIERVNKSIGLLIWNELKSDKIKLKIEKHEIQPKSEMQIVAMNHENKYVLNFYYEEEFPMKELKM
jgi:hypothetical protein